MKAEYVIYTADGMSFTEGDRTVVAVVAADSVVLPALGKLTALIVRNGGGLPS